MPVLVALVVRPIEVFVRGLARFSMYRPLLLAVLVFMVRVFLRRVGLRLYPIPFGIMGEGSFLYCTLSAVSIKQKPLARGKWLMYCVQCYVAEILNHKLDSVASTSARTDSCDWNGGLDPSQ